MRAIATHFADTGFRSRLESYSYEYLRLMYKPMILHYEPRHYQGEKYLPDFMVSHDNFHFAVEVKPDQKKANYALYKSWLKEFTDVQSVLVLTSRDAVRIYPHGTMLPDAFDRLLFFQAINNVKHFLRTSKQST